VGFTSVDNFLEPACVYFSNELELAFKSVLIRFSLSKLKTHKKFVTDESRTEGVLIMKMVSLV
jgi:hypothetical protein